MADPWDTEEHGDDPPGMIPFGNLETALHREAEAVAERFPETDFAVVDTAVREVFAELRAEAAVETHILALTRHRAVDRLEEQGHTSRPAIVHARRTHEAGSRSQLCRAPSLKYPTISFRSGRNSA